MQIKSFAETVIYKEFRSQNFATFCFSNHQSIMFFLSLVILLLIMFPPSNVRYQMGKAVFLYWINFLTLALCHLHNFYRFFYLKDRSAVILQFTEKSFTIEMCFIISIISLFLFINCKSQSNHTLGLLYFYFIYIANVFLIITSFLLRHHMMTVSFVSILFLITQFLFLLFVTEILKRFYTKAKELEKQIEDIDKKISECKELKHDTDSKVLNLMIKFLEKLHAEFSSLQVVPNTENNIRDWDSKIEELLNFTIYFKSRNNENCQNFDQNFKDLNSLYLKIKNSRKTASHNLLLFIEATFYDEALGSSVSDFESLVNRVKGDVKELNTQIQSHEQKLNRVEA